MLTMIELPEHVEAMVEFRAMAALITEADHRVQEMQEFLAVIAASGMTYDSAADRTFIERLQHMSALVQEVLVELAAARDIAGATVSELITTICSSWDTSLAGVSEDVQNAAERAMLSCMERIAARF